MKKLLILLCAFTALCLCTAALGEVTLSNTLNGKKFDVTYPDPARIVSTSGVTTEMLLALGLGDRIAGCCGAENDIYYEYVDAYAALNQLGEGWPSEEALLGVEPDFLIGMADCFSDEHFNREFCEKNGIAPYVPKIAGKDPGIEAIYEDLTNLGEIFSAQDQAAWIVSSLQSRIDLARAVVADQEVVRVFLYDTGDEKPVTLGGGIASALIRAAGGRNVFESKFTGRDTVTWKAVAEADPQYIIVLDSFSGGDAQQKCDALYANEALAEVDAVQNGNIFILALTDVAGGIRSADTVEIMSDHFHLESFL